MAERAPSPPSMIIASYTCTCCGETAEWTGTIPHVHVTHPDFHLRCDICRIGLLSPSEALAHFESCSHIARCYTEYFDRTQPHDFSHSVRREISSPPMRQVALCSQDTSLTVSTFEPLVQMARCPVIEPARAVPVTLPPRAWSDRMLLRIITDHLFWLARLSARSETSTTITVYEFISHLVAWLVTTPSPLDEDARRYLAFAFPELVRNPREITIEGILQVLLPIYRTWVDYADQNFN